MSESGIIDAFFFLGPSPLDVFKQYAKVTGVTPLPQVQNPNYAGSLITKFTQIYRFRLDVGNWKSSMQVELQR